jgi:hypothetical protein
MPHGAWEMIIEFAVILLCPIIYPLYLQRRGVPAARAWQGFGWFLALYLVIGLVALRAWLVKHPLLT